MLDGFTDTHIIDANNNTEGRTMRASIRKNQKANYMDSRTNVVTTGEHWVVVLSDGQRLKLPASMDKNKVIEYAESRFGWIEELTVA